MKTFTRRVKPNNMLACIALAVSLHATQSIAQQDNAALVSVEPVKTQKVYEQIWVPATVVSRNDSNIAAEVSGRIMWMADVGDKLQAGQVIARLDDALLQLNKQQDQANIAKWQARVDLLTRKQKRFSKILQSQGTSENQLEEITAELEVSRQELAQAQLDAKLTQHRLAQTEIKAPFDSLVVKRLQNPGEFTNTGQALIQLVDTSEVEAMARAPLSTVPYIRAGETVAVKDKLINHQRTIRTLVPVGNARSRMMEVRVTLDPDDFLIGSAVRVALPHSKAHRALTVPRDALVLRKSGTYIYQIDPEQQARQVMVTTGIGVDQHIEVFGDLSPSEPVVVRGAERLRAGQKVRFAEDTVELVAKAN